MLTIPILSSPVGDGLIQYTEGAKEEREHSE